MLSFFSLNCTGIALRLVLRFVSYFHSLVSVHSLKLCLDLGLMSSRPTMMPSQCSPSSIFPGGFVHELHGDCCKIEDCIEIVVIAWESCVKDGSAAKNRCRWWSFWMRGVPPLSGRVFDALVWVGWRNRSQLLLTGWSSPRLVLYSPAVMCTNCAGIAAGLRIVVVFMEFSWVVGDGVRLLWMVLFVLPRLQIDMI